MEEELQHKNKYQYADVINNEEVVHDVYIIGDSIQILVPPTPEDLSWIQSFLDRHDYEHRQSVQTNTEFVKDIYRPVNDENETTAESDDEPEVVVD